MSNMIPNVDTMVPNAGTSANPPLPGDVLSSASTPPVAAHSMARKLFAAYSGKLFQVRRASDNATMDIGTLSDGFADVPSLLTFISGTTGTISKIYDQTGNNNVLPQATNANQGALTLRYTQLGREVPVVTIASGQFYRNRTSTTGIPTGANPITVMMVVTNALSSFIGTYGDVESTVANTGNGHMFSLAHSQHGIGVDWENGVFYQATGAAGTSSQPQQNADFVFGLSKTDAVSSWVIKGGPATSQIIYTQFSGGLPTGYSAHFEGGLSLGEGGDGTAAPVEFVEGIIVAAVTTDAADQAIQNNLAFSFGQYGGLQQYPDSLRTGNPVILTGAFPASANGWGVSLEINRPNPTIELNDSEVGGHDWRISAEVANSNPCLIIFDQSARSGSGINYASFSIDGKGSWCLVPGAGYLWTADTNFADDTPDTSLSRLSAGVVAVGNGTIGDHTGKINGGGVFVGSDTYANRDTGAWSCQILSASAKDGVYIQQNGVVAWRIGVRAAADGDGSLYFNGVGDTLQTGFSLALGTTSVGCQELFIGAGAIATNATSGFLYHITCAGQPTGTPSGHTGNVASVYDTTNHILWIYDNGAWRQPKTPGGAAIVTWQ